MKIAKSILVAGAASLAAANSFALTVNYGWEDGNTVLGGFSNSNLTYSNTNALTHSGNGALLIEDNDAADNATTQSYVAWINGLTTGDQITVSFWTWDNSAASGAPSVRIWGHYTNDPADVTNYEGSASGNNTYSVGQGTWDQLSYTWTFDAASSFDGDANGLMIEARYYDSSSVTTGFALIDDLTVTVNSQYAMVTTPGGVSPVPAPAAVWMFGSALLGLAGIGRQRRARA